MTASRYQHEQRFAFDRRELAEIIASLRHEDGNHDVRPGINVGRYSGPTELYHGFLDPCLCVIAEGAKVLTLGEESFRYDSAHYMIATVGVPMTAQVVEATKRKPYLSFRLTLDPAVVASVMIESGALDPSGDCSVRAIDVSPLDGELLGAIVRLMRLVGDDDAYAALSGLVTREIVYRLLTGEQAGRMRHLAKLGGQSHRMARAVQLIRGGFDRHLRIDDLASELNMSVSGFHAHFKAVTAMTPLQYQKQLRLQEARRLMLNEELDAGEAGHRVGYDDASQFSREYKRLFGLPPKRDIEEMRSVADAG